MSPEFVLVSTALSVNVNMCVHCLWLTANPFRVHEWLPWALSSLGVMHAQLIIRHKWGRVLKHYLQVIREPKMGLQSAISNTCTYLLSHKQLMWVNKISKYWLLSQLRLEKVIGLTGFVIIHVFIASFSPAQGECNQMVNAKFTRPVNVMPMSSSNQVLVVLLPWELEGIDKARRR